MKDTLYQEKEHLRKQIRSHKRYEVNCHSEMVAHNHFRIIEILKAELKELEEDN